MSAPAPRPDPTNGKPAVDENYEDFWAAPTAAQRLEEARQLQRDAHARQWRRIFYIVIFALVAFGVWKALAR